MKHVRILRSHRSSRAWFVISVHIALLGCGTSERNALPSGGAELAVALEPAVSIGVAKGEEEYQLHQVRSAFELENGTIVVANAGASELRYYDAQGRHIRTIGREGQGPGEFTNLRYARALRGDTVVTWDVGQRRVSYFDKEGELAREFTVDLSAHTIEISGSSVPAYPVEMVARWDGMLLFQPAMPVYVLSGLGDDGSLDRSRIAPNGVYRITHSLFLVDPEGRVVRTLEPVEGAEWYLNQGVRQIRFLGHWFYMAAGRNVFSFGSGKPYAFYTLDGEEGPDLVETGMPTESVSSDVWSERIERAASGFANQAAGDRLRTMPKPDTMPSYSGLLVDDLDQMWALDFDMARSAVPYTVGVAHDISATAKDHQSWTIFNKEGATVGMIALPRNVTVTSIARGRLVAVVRDEFGVERVQVYALLPTG